MKKISSPSAIKNLTVEDYKEILDAYHEFEDCGALSIRQYFYTLFFDLWVQGEGFNSKRPFGNSGWDRDLFAALIDIGAIKGELDEYNCAYAYDKETAEIILSHCINVVFFGEI